MVHRLHPDIDSSDWHQVSLPSLPPLLLPPIPLSLLYLRLFPGSLERCKSTLHVLQLCVNTHCSFAPRHQWRRLRPLLRMDLASRPSLNPPMHESPRRSFLNCARKELPRSGCNLSCNWCFSLMPLPSRFHSVVLAEKLAIKRLLRCFG